MSADLKQWEHREPFLVPGLAGAPECPDYFAWNGWYYLIFSNGGIARYRMSREPLGPWIRPEVDMLDGPAARVMKTAPFTGGRQIGVAWLGTRKDNRDAGVFEFGGHAVFRELRQFDDGTLGMTFPDEMIPVGTPLSDGRFSVLGSGGRVEGGQIHLAPGCGLAAVECPGVPRDVRLAMRVVPQGGCGGFGLRLRAGGSFDSGYDLHVAPCDRLVRLGDQVISGCGWAR